jgi:hypothetical protein
LDSISLRAFELMANCALRPKKRQALPNSNGRTAYDPNLSPPNLAQVY